MSVVGLGHVISGCCKSIELLVVVVRRRDGGVKIEVHDVKHISWCPEYEL